jgi:hypothetical protein
MVRTLYDVLITGIVLSIETRKILQANLTTPWKSLDHAVEQITTRKQRAVLPLNRECKSEIKLLSDFCGAGLSQVLFLDLKHRIQEINMSICNLLSSSTQQDGETFKCHPALKSFFLSCSKQIFPAAQFIPPKVYDVISRFLLTTALEHDDMAFVATHAPNLAKFLAYYYTVQDTERAEFVILASYTRFLLF